jgi:S1-C subfamily serine protease
MLDHTRRILIVLAIFITSGWLYREWRVKQGGGGLFEVLKKEKPEVTPAISDAPKLSAADVPGLSRLSEESAKIAATVLPSVVSIDTRSLEKVAVPNAFNLPVGRLELRPGLGSGVIVSQEGYVITNFHVIKNVVVVNNEPLLRITTQDGKQYRASLSGFDEELDIAVLHIEGGKGGFPTLPLGDSDKVRTGEIAFAVGNPLGLAGSVTQGIISATQRRFSDTSHEMIQTDTVINPGNSGGPLINVFGEIIGINAAIEKPDAAIKGWQGVGLAVPANDVRAALDAIMTQRSPQAGFLGITFDEKSVMVTVPTNPDKKYHGSVVSFVAPGSPAEKGGFLVGDVVILFDGKTFDEPFQFMREMRRVRAGETKPFDIIRGDRRMTLNVTFGPRPKTTS